MNIIEGKSIINIVPPLTQTLCQIIGSQKRILAKKSLHLWSNTILLGRMGKMKKPAMGHWACVACVVCLLSVGSVSAQTPIEKPNLSIPSQIGPAYFGPNAFPIPDMLDGRTSEHLKVEFYVDGFVGTTTGNLADDLTTNIFTRLTIPLFTPRANLTVWMPIVEYFHTSAEVNADRRLPHTGDLEGFDSGDVYVSADISLLTQEAHNIDLVARTVLKTASANRFAEGRCYDAPGYFFDVAAGREFSLGGGRSVRAAISSGFLCWQTDNGRQNDAVMYGLMTSYTHNRLTLATTYGGYIGWEGDGDCPMSVKASVGYDLGRLQLRMMYQGGLYDWPYHQLRLGVAYLFSR